VAENIYRNSCIVTGNISPTKITTQDRPKFRTKKDRKDREYERKDKKELHREQKPVMLGKD